MSTTKKVTNYSFFKYIYIDIACCGSYYPKNVITPKHKTQKMLYKVKLKNSHEEVLLDVHVFEFLNKDEYLNKVKFLENLRRHSSGCAVFQKTSKKAEGGYSTETIYLHKLIAETFLLDQKKGEKDLVGAKNGNKLDCRLDNICWRTRAVASRKRKTSSKTGYTGVYQENNRFRAVISINRKSIHIGMFDTAENAALAYNKKSLELFGNDGKINEIRVAERSELTSTKAPETRQNNSDGQNGQAGRDMSNNSDFYRSTGF